MTEENIKSNIYVIDYPLQQTFNGSFNFSLSLICNCEKSSCSWCEYSSLRVLECALKTRYLISCWGAGRGRELEEALIELGAYRTGRVTRKERLQIFVTSSITTGEFCIGSDPL